MPFSIHTWIRAQWVKYKIVRKETPSVIYNLGFKQNEMLIVNNGINPNHSMV